METIIRYLSHPQVQIEEAKEIHLWSLDAIGRQRVDRLVKSNALKGTTRVISSMETKAIETAQPIADALGCDLEIRALMHENDRTATGFLPQDEFEKVADAFFAHPDESVRGWETANAAQARIVRAIEKCLKTQTEGHVLIVGHGGVGTLLFCALAGIPIARKHDQGAGGGWYFEFTDAARKPMAPWRRMENL